MKELIQSLANPTEADIASGWHTTQLTKEQAIALHDSDEWKSLPLEQLFNLAFYQHLLCVPFDKFHQAAEAALGRPVWTHEFAFRDALLNELKTKQKPTMTQIIGLLPAEKTILIAPNPSPQQPE